MKEQKNLLRFYSSVAKHYAELNWPLIRANGKMAVEPDWGNIPPLEKDLVESTLRNGGNIGLRLGPKAGLIDIEADSPEAEVVIKNLFGGEIPPTPTFKSRRGFHRIFAWDDRLDELGKSVCKYEGVEFRIGANCKSTMSLVPPSVTDGHKREWLPQLAPWEVRPARLPPEIISKLQDRKNKSRIKTEPVKEGKTSEDKTAEGKIKEGKRNDWLTSVAGKLRHEGSSRNTIEAALLAVNKEVCDPPLSNKDVKQIAASVAEYPSAAEAKSNLDNALFPDLQPWPKAVNGKKLLAEVESYLGKYIILPSGAGLVIAAWTMSAWGCAAWDRFPHLSFTSPAKRCGKTRALQILGLICPRPLSASSISPAVVYRIVELHQPTLLIDEAQCLSRRGSESSEALRELLNAGIDRTSKVLRMGGTNFDQVRAFSVYGPKVLALIGEMDNVLADRCINIRMERKTEVDKIAPWRSRVVEEEAKPLARKLKRWVEDNQDRLAKTYDGMKSFPLKNDRLAELLLPLQAVLGLADPKRLPELERMAKGMDVSDVEVELPEIRLLSATREIFPEENDFIPSTDLFNALIQRTEEPWRRWHHGKEISYESIAKLLRPFDVRPKQAKDRNVRGYYRVDFERAWKRYLPAPPIKTRPTRPTRPVHKKARKTQSK